MVCPLCRFKTGSCSDLTKGGCATSPVIKLPFFLFFLCVHIPVICLEGATRQSWWVHAGQQLCKHLILWTPFERDTKVNPICEGSPCLHSHLSLNLPRPPCIHGPSETSGALVSLRDFEATCWVPSLPQRCCVCRRTLPAPCTWR